MTAVESAAARMLEPLSTLFQKPLRLVDPRSTEAVQAFAVRSVSPRLCIATGDGTPLNEPERRLLQELLDVLRLAHESDAKYAELEHRLTAMQRENVELTIRSRELSEVASRDSLTGLYNRWYVIEKLDAEIGRALRHESAMALLMLDVDHFKSINDTFGHLVGDQVLQWIGRALKESCRVYDIPGRFGGEEFCVLLPETNPMSTAVVAERIRNRIAEAELEFGDSRLRVTASIGIAGIDPKQQGSVLTPGALVDRADRALYSAKNRGRNCVQLWDAGDFEPGPADRNH